MAAAAQCAVGLPHIAHFPLLMLRSLASLQFTKKNWRTLFWDAVVIGKVPIVLMRMPWKTAFPLDFHRGGKAPWENSHRKLINPHSEEKLSFSFRIIWKILLLKCCDMQLGVNFVNLFERLLISWQSCLISLCLGEFLSGCLHIQHLFSISSFHT